MRKDKVGSKMVGGDENGFDLEGKYRKRITTGMPPAFAMVATLSGLLAKIPIAQHALFMSTGSHECRRITSINSYRVRVGVRMLV